MIRVLIADDQALVRHGFRLILQSEDDIDVAGEAGDGAEAVAAALRLDPDVVLMDVRMPRMDGIEATRRLSASGSAARVLILTTFDVDEHVFAALEAGASGFLLKDVDADGRVNAVRVVARGDGLLAPVVTKRLIAKFARRRPPPRVVAPAVEELTERETDVLRVLAQGLTNPEIARALGVSETTVKTHVAHILAKLGLRHRVQAVIHAYRAGLVERGG